MSKPAAQKLPPYRSSLAGTLLAAREAVMAHIRPRLRAMNVTEQQWRVLRVLAEQPSLDAASIAAEAILHPPSVTRILKELDQRGLIERHTSPEDARRSIVAITAGGRALFDAMSPYTLELLKLFGDSFGDQRLAALQDELAAFTARLRTLPLRE